MDEPATRLSSAEDEMVACAPILEGGMRTATFKTDMMKVWGMISVIRKDLYCLTHVKSSNSTRDGKKAYSDL